MLKFIFSIKNANKKIMKEKEKIDFFCNIYDCNYHRN